MNTKLVITVVTLALMMPIAYSSAQPRQPQRQMSQQMEQVQETMQRMQRLMDRTQQFSESVRMRMQNAQQDRTRQQYQHLQQMCESVDMLVKQMKTTTDRLHLMIQDKDMMQDRDMDHDMDRLRDRLNDMATQAEESLKIMEQMRDRIHD